MIRSMERSTITNGEWYKSMSAGFVAVGDYELIETHILASAASEVVFSSLATYASVYKHLQIRGVGRTNKADTDDLLKVRLNGDTGSNYSSHFLFAAGATLVSGGAVSQTSIDIGRLTAATTDSNVFGPIVVDILDPYATTNIILRGFGGAGRATNPFVELRSGTFFTANPVTSITLLNGASFVAGTRYSLYGIRG